MTFERQIESAKRLIAKNGQNVTWRKPARTVADPDKPWIVTPVAPVEYDTKICFLPIDRVNERYIDYINQTEVPIGSEYGLMGQVAFDVEISDVVIRDGKEYRIANFDLLSPNGEKILYTIYFSK